jgi:hypothetical protein
MKKSTNSIFFILFSLFIGLFNTSLYAESYKIIISDKGNNSRFLIVSNSLSFDLSCDENSIDNLDGTCTVTLQADTTIICPSGFYFSSGQCYRPVTYNAYYGCQHKVDVGGLCYSSWGKIWLPNGSLGCPNGATPHGNKCVKLDGSYSNKFYYCGSGAGLSGTTCHATYYTTGTVSCPSTYLLINSICEKDVIVQANKTCPEGYSLNEEETKCKK